MTGVQSVPGAHYMRAVPDKLDGVYFVVAYYHTYTYVSAHTIPGIYNGCTIGMYVCL